MDLSLSPFSFVPTSINLFPEGNFFLDIDHPSYYPFASEDLPIPEIEISPLAEQEIVNIPCIDFTFHTELTKRILELLKEKPLSFSENRANNTLKEIINHTLLPQSDFYKVKKKITSSSDCDVTFWIQFIKNTNEVSIQINKPKQVIGKGTFKRVKLTLDITLPSLKTKTLVRLRPLGKKEEWNSDVLTGFNYHQELFNFFTTKNVPGITDPPQPRISHLQEQVVSAQKLEYTQTFYPHLLQSASFKNLQLHIKLKACFDLFSSLQNTHAGTFVHKDVKHNNISLDSNFSVFLNDFDICTKKALGNANAYVFWDKSAQKGIITPYCDIVGAAITTLYVAFPIQSFSDFFYKEADHTIFKKRTSVANICKLLNVNSQNNKTVLKSLVTLVCELIKKEDKVFDYICGSLYSFFTTDYKNIEAWTVDRFKKFIASPDQESLDEYLKKKEITLEESNIDIIGRYLLTPAKTSEEERGQKLYKSIISFYHKLSFSEREALRDIAEQHIWIRNLFLHIKHSKTVNLKKSTPNFFRNLLSTEPSDRLQAFKELETIAPNVQYAKDTLEKLMAELASHEK